MRIVLMIMLMLNLASAKKLALVIGNSDYKQGFLPNPTKDADLIAQKLREVGFTVTPKNNIETAEDMKDVINDFAKTVKNDDIAVVYYAGHGVQCKGTNYLIPTKAKIAKGGQLKSEALKLDFLIGGMSNIKLAILMIDACRDNAYPSCTKSQKRGLAQPSEAEQGMIISFATGKNQTADDGDEHSPYALALAKFINKKMPIETFFREVGGEVFASSSQRPILKNNFYGNFSFGSNINIQFTSESTQKPISASKWITPTDSVCKANGGKIYKGVCHATWKNAKNICSANKGKLPTRSELKKVITDCGGEMKNDNTDERERNKSNSYYQNCYKKKGFSANDYYWTSEEEDWKDSFHAWYINFSQGNDNWHDTFYEDYVVCVSGQ